MLNWLLKTIRESKFSLDIEKLFYRWIIIQNARDYSLENMVAT